MTLPLSKEAVRPVSGEGRAVHQSTEVSVQNVAIKVGNAFSRGALFEAALRAETLG
jgi:hypothetical protein